MYNKIIKRYYILKLFSFCIPLSKNIRKTNFYLCKYIIKNTPYGNILNFIKELHKILLINKNLPLNNKFVLSCSRKIFALTFYYKYKKNIKKQFLNYNTVFILCGNNYNSKQIAFFKDKKIPSIGFINYHNLSHITDFTLLLQSKYFASTFLVYYFIKKIFKKW